jgi:ABC-2 type transport system permease protein
MYWYKPWRETRTVILFGVAAMAMACGGILWAQQTMRDHADVPMTFIQYIWKGTYNSFARDLFVILAILLGSGGLLQEKAHGTSGFTLALPVSRSRILWMRAVVGYLGVLAIALTPAVVLPLGARFMGLYYPAAQALGFSLLWAGCGAVFYGYTFLLAHQFEGEYTAPLVAVPSLMLYGAATALPWLAQLPMLNIFHLLNGEDMPFFNEQQALLTGPMPWLALAVMVMIAAALVASASRRMTQRDF